MPPSQLAQYALYAASAISAGSIAGHTQMGYEVVLPSLRRLITGKKDDDGTIAAKIGWWEVNQGFGVMGTAHPNYFLSIHLSPERRAGGAALAQGLVIVTGG